MELKNFQRLIFLHFFLLIFQNINLYQYNNVTFKVSYFSIFFTILISFLLIIKNNLSPKITLIDFLIFIPVILSLNIFFYLESKEQILTIALNVYIFILYYSYKIILNNNLIKVLLNEYLKVAFFASLIGILGWLLYQFFNYDYFVLAKEYPLKLFKSARAKSFFSHSNYFFLFICPGLILAFNNILKEKNFKNYLYFYTILAAIILTFTKSLILIISLYLIFLFFNSNNFLKKILLFFLFIAFALFYFTFSHLIVVSKNSKNYEYYTSKKFITNKNKMKLYEFKNFEIYLNNYYQLKKSSYELSKKNFIIGNGEFKFKKFNQNFLDKPSSNNHHSHYFNILASKGLLGLLNFILILTLCYKKILSQNRIDFFLFLSLLWLTLEGINTDLNSLNFLWLLIALIDKKNK